ncbi:Transposase, IS605 OrfB [Nitrosococcus oceani ATCC 19707]|uniref:Transposase, IS605 OrfB n=1 Tax=Nitrosococcus oceani (strain ATCC 19707 / BCRC 17464 / JCM 30415 / NCIMB 11848 / C-107) TaxID=323261 RepID=Q3J938_NITOC|nr:RNA-guided endonuclease TnpB family protein [Nitrosococcus oceani]ABA58658.1 Transposase, IS605 OrfB [Nitrosococcus oceani ATCC 19707]GEM19778.1 transposase [Nitrosococcus oceani]
MKLVANLKLTPTPAQERELRLTLARCNEACNWLSERAWETKTFRQYDLHKLCYQAVRAKFALSAQVAVRCIAKVAHAYKLDQKTQRAFRKHAAHPYDDRILRFVCDEKVSLWLLSGREKIGYVGSDHQRQLLEHRKGEVDLMFVRGQWYLAAVCDFDDPKLLTPEGMLGVDFGIVNIATDSLGERYCGAKVQAYRERYAKRRATLQRLGTRAAKRCLRHISGRQKRFQKYENHCISKRIVSTAERSRLGIGLENLKHIRARVKANKAQRKRLHNWGFAQLRAFIEYKAKRAGVPVVIVDPRNTSRECPACGRIDKANRPTQSEFRCVECGHSNHADHNAAGNIARRAAVTQPMFAHKCAPCAVESRQL